MVRIFFSNVILSLVGFANYDINVQYILQKLRYIDTKLDITTGRVHSSRRNCGMLLVVCGSIGGRVSLGVWLSERIICWKDLMTSGPHFSPAGRRPLSRQDTERERESFRRALRVKSCADLCDITRRLKQLYIDALNVPGGIERYLAALRFALELTCEKSNEKEGRINCLKMSAHVALALSQEGMHEPLQLLVDFCVDMSDLCVTITRSYVCALAGLLLNLNKLIANRLREQNPERIDCSPLSKDLRSSLFAILSKRLLDVNPLVRSEALKAIATLQDEQAKTDSYQTNSPKRLLMSHLNDVSYECRIVNMALSDAEEKVRRAATVRIIRDVDLKALSIKQRMDLVQGVMNMSTRSQNQTVILNDLLKEWLKTACGVDTLPDNGEELSSFYCVASSHLLRFLEPLTQEQVSHDLMLHSLQYCREKMGFGSIELQHFVKTLNRNAEDISLHRHNCNKLIEEGILSLDSARTSKCCILLALPIDFCKSKCITDADWSECHYRLLPTMRTFCELMQNYMITVLSSDETEALFALKNFTVMQLLKIISLFDHGDSSGWKTWQISCENVLSNMQLNLTDALVNELVQQMYTHLWPLPEQNYEALSNLCDLTSSIVHRALFPNATVLAANQTIGIGGNETVAEIENAEVDDDAVYRCIMIVSAMLKTNRYKKMNALLHGVLENVIERSVVAADVNCRILAFEAMGILAMYDRRVAFEKTILIKETLKIDQRLRPTMLNILCNMALLHGYSMVSRWFGAGLDSSTPNDELLQVFAEYIDSLDPETSFTACECLCKMFLKEANITWTSILSRLLLKAFDPATNSIPKLKACLVTFIPVFAEWSRDHQMLLVEAFPETFDALRSDEQFVGSLSRINTAAVGSCFVHATSSQLLHDADKELVDHFVHCSVLIFRRGQFIPFMPKILAALSDDPEDDYAPIYCKMLSDIDANDWTDIAQINALIADTEDVIDLYSDTEETRGYIRSLASFSKNYEKELLHGDSESVDEHDDDDENEILKISKLVLRESNKANGCNPRQTNRAKEKCVLIRGLKIRLRQYHGKSSSAAFQDFVRFFGYKFCHNGFLSIATIQDDIEIVWNNGLPKFTKAKSISRDMKTLLREDIDQNKDDTSDNDEIFRNKPNSIAITPGVQRQRPILARAAKSAQKMLKEADSLNEEE
ncbi:BMA-CAPG-1, isoform i [Dirofilaria immitis]|nr:BMA-CAPG-1, isoform i [Dirofilaria immitis]